MAGPFSEVNTEMNSLILVISTLLFIGTFFLAPERTSLKTALRYNVKSKEILFRFSKLSISRIAITVIGYAALIISFCLKSPTWFFLSLISALVILYITDFIAIEKIAKNIYELN